MLRRRVLHVVNTSRGIRLHIAPIARALQAEGWEVDVAAPAGSESELLAAQGTGFVPLPISRSLVSLAHVGTFRRIVSLLRRGNYGLVHLHTLIPAVLGRAAAGLVGVPAIYHCRGTFYSEGGELPSERVVRAVYPWVERALAPTTSWTFTLNAEDAGDLVRLARAPADRVTCLGVGGCGLDMSVWDPARFPAAERARLRGVYGVPADRLVVGFVGRLVREKGVMELADAFASLCSAGVDAHLLVVGGAFAGERDTSTHDEFLRRLDAAGVLSRVTLTGLVETPAEPMSIMDMLVLPSYREGFGQVLVEAGALGAPVVAADSRGARHAVVPDVTGLLVPKRNATALADALARLARDPELRQRLGDGGRSRALLEMGQETVLRKITETYRRIADEA